MKAIIYTAPDGQIAIVHPVISIDDAPGFNEEQALERARARLPDDAQQVRVVDRSEIPADRRFRDAWKNDLTIDIVKARVITRQRLQLLHGHALTPEQLAQIDAATTPDQLLAIA